jgi:hypothetical protein
MIAINVQMHAAMYYQVVAINSRFMRYLVLLANDCYQFASVSSNVLANGSYQFAAYSLPCISTWLLSMCSYPQLRICEWFSINLRVICYPVLANGCY